MNKIFTIIGTRPNVLKVDPDLKQTVIWTGQHFTPEMGMNFFDDLNIPDPKYNLKCTNVGKMVDKLRALFHREKPDMILVFGDTYSSLAGALAAAYEGIQVAHVEAGLRSHDMKMPEEINRVLIDKIARIRFCPNTESEINLLKEGIRSGVHMVGDPMFDTLGRFLPIKRSKQYKKFNLLTLHRNFNADHADTLINIFEAIKESNERFIFPIHPRTEKHIEEFKIKVPKNIKVIPPQPYKKSLELISDAKKVVTDSGGVQRESAWLNTPVIILREETEWTGIIAQGSGVLVGSSKEKILDAIKNFRGKLIAPPEFGANKRIREILFKYL